LKHPIHEQLKQQIVDTGVEMIERGITVGTWGNISLRDPESGYIYISPSGMEYTQIEARHVVVLTEELELIDGEAEPSIEKPMHAAVYKQRPDVHAIIHTHPVFSTAFGVAGLPLPGVSEDFVQIVGAEVAIAEPYALPGTPELGETAVRGLGARNAVILPGHGALSVAADMKSALKVSQVLEKNAQICIYAKMLGGELRRFSDAEIAAMQDFARNHYGKKNASL
jgi:L-fuculose-phosphate aldolase